MPTTPRTPAAAAVATRALALVGVDVGSDAALLSRTLDRAVDTAAINHAIAAARPSDALRPGDVIAFRLHGRQHLLAVVVTRRGPRVRFVYRFAGQGRVGVLNARQPNRRRLPGERRVANTYLRPVRPGEAPLMRRLAGQLLEGRLPL